MHASDRLRLGGARVHHTATALAIPLAVGLPLDEEIKALLGRTLPTRIESATHQLSIVTKSLFLP